MRAITLCFCCSLLLAAGQPAVAIAAQGSQPPPAHYGDVIIDNRYSGSPGFAGTWNDPESGDIITSVIAPRQPMQGQGQAPMYVAPVVSPGSGYNDGYSNRPDDWQHGPAGDRPGGEHGRPPNPQHGPQHRPQYGPQHGAQPMWGQMPAPTPGQTPSHQPPMPQGQPPQAGPHWGQHQGPPPLPNHGQGQWGQPQVRPQTGAQPPAMPRPMPPASMPGMGGR